MNVGRQYLGQRSIPSNRNLFADDATRSVASKLLVSVDPHFPEVCTLESFEFDAQLSNLIRVATPEVTSQGARKDSFLVDVARRPYSPHAMPLTLPWRTEQPCASMSAVTLTQIEV